MPKRIDHEKRKVEMLYAALEVYATEGKNANLSLIASKCGLSRTTVYQYFKDESDLFHYAVKYTTDVAFGIYSSEQYEAVTDPVEKLYMITTDIMNRADTYERQIGNFLKTIDQIEGLPDLIKHRTAKLVLLFSRLVRQAIKEGKMKKCSPQDIANKLEVTLESYLFHMVFFPQNKQAIREIVADIIRINVIE
ncbi:MAG: TetR/AcrR family transcriptional regulator [Sphaerochaetaceae bacterium]|nr:TetR/AcrR family transcriptional regulator [Sphaerochaetaceae bacterium]